MAKLTNRRPSNRFSTGQTRRWPYRYAPAAWHFKLAVDERYRADGVDQHLLELGIQPVIPPKDNEARETCGIELDREAYLSSNILERLMGWLGESHRTLSRSEKTAKNYGAMLDIASIRRLLRILY